MNTIKNKDIIPTWNQTSTVDQSPSAYMLHYLVDTNSSFDAHCEKIASIIDAASEISAVYPKTCAYICNDTVHITYEKITQKIRSFLHTNPKVLPITVISLSHTTGAPEISADIIKYMIRQTKRLAHPPIIFKRWLINLEGIAEPVFAIIAHPAEISQQLSRIHMIHAPNTINFTTQLDFLDKTTFYSHMEVTGTSH